MSKEEAIEMQGTVLETLPNTMFRVELENYMFQHGADSLAFGTIIASGPNKGKPKAVGITASGTRAHRGTAAADTVIRV